jgi:serine/threonine-protein kinase RsbW
MRPEANGFTELSRNRHSFLKKLVQILPCELQNPGCRSHAFCLQFGAGDFRRRPPIGRHCAAVIFEHPVMSPNLTDHQEQLILQLEKLSEIAQVPRWIEALVLRFAIPENVQFAIQLCLEEVLSNIVLHGSCGRPDHRVVVHFSASAAGEFLVSVDDEAPRFNPLEQQELPALNPNEEMRIGGQGLRLLRQFAHTLAYEPTPVGNRMKMGFSTLSLPDPGETSR